MEAVDLAEAAAGGVLLFALPGFAVARALFPEWRFRGPDGARRALETATLAFVLSVALTVLVGSALLGLAPGGFQAAWSDPVLEVSLAAIAVVALVAAALRGAFGGRPVADRPVDLSEEGAAELGKRLDALAREDRRLAREGGRESSESPRAAEIGRRRAEIAHEIDALEGAREEAYAR